MGLHIGGIARVRFCDEVDGEGVTVAAEGDLVALNVQFATGVAESVCGGLEVLWIDFAKGDGATGYGACGEEGSGFDAVWNDGVFCTVKFGDTFDGDASGAGAFDTGAHAVEEVGKVNDFGFCCGAFDDGGAFGEAGCHHDVVGAENGWTLFTFEVDGISAEVVSEHFNVAVFDAARGIDGAESFEVEIDGTVADDATAWQGNGGFAFSAEEGSEDAHGGAHFSDDVVWGSGFDGFGVDGDGAAGAFHVGSEVGQDLEHVVDIAEVGHLMDDAA